MLINLGHDVLLLILSELDYISCKNFCISNKEISKLIEAPNFKKLIREKKEAHDLRILCARQLQMQIFANSCFGQLGR